MALFLDLLAKEMLSSEMAKISGCDDCVGRESVRKGRAQDSRTTSTED